MQAPHDRARKSERRGRGAGPQVAVGPGGRCRSCGGKLREGARFCPACGCRRGSGARASRSLVLAAVLALVGLATVVAILLAAGGWERLTPRLPEGWQRPLTSASAAAASPATERPVTLPPSLRFVPADAALVDPRLAGEVVVGAAFPEVGEASSIAAGFHAADGSGLRWSVVQAPDAGAAEALSRRYRDEAARLYRDLPGQVWSGVHRERFVITAVAYGAAAEPHEEAVARLAERTRALVESRLESGA